MAMTIPISSEGKGPTNVVVLMHIHSVFSDGNRLISELVELARGWGARFIVSTDHTEEIRETQNVYDRFRLSALGIHIVRDPKPHSVDEWVKVMGNLGVVNGTEFGLGYRRSSHLLYVCSRRDTMLPTYQSLVDIAETYGESNPILAIEKIEDLAVQNDAVLVLAHPFSFLCSFTQRLTPRVGLRVGVEFLNSSYRKNDKTFDLLCKIQQDFPDCPAIATGGCDYHGDLISTAAEVALSSPASVADVYGDVYEPPTSRFTIVQALSVSSDGVAEAIRNGWCYAAYKSARIVEATCWPGRKYTPNDGPFRLKFSGFTLNRHTIRVAAVSRKTHQLIAKGKGTMTSDVFAFNLRDFLEPDKNGNDGWWLLIGTDEVVLSAMEIMLFPKPKPPQQVAQKDDGNDVLRNILEALAGALLEDALSGGGGGGSKPSPQNPQPGPNPTSSSQGLGHFRGSVKYYGGSGQQDVVGDVVETGFTNGVYNIRLTIEFPGQPACTRSYNLKLAHNETWEVRGAETIVFNAGKGEICDVGIVSLTRGSVRPNEDGYQLNLDSILERGHRGTPAGGLYALPACRLIDLYRQGR
ncbi:MAG: hypothetical protein NTZ65_02190 [Candidatus Berkelbacteria bacterium]|nr:hypothetical protein [Candidatus Berkelbacteria bacterium]